MTCRSCGALELVPILSLGDMALANAYRDPSDGAAEPTYPLDLVRCTSCHLVQITCTVAPEILFRDYRYLSSGSTTMLAHVERLVSELVVDRRLGPESLVVEVASNDGYLLQYYVQAGIPVLGIEPARNVAQLARDRGIRTVDEFFDTDLALRLRAEGRPADVIHANNVLAHVADLNSVVAGLRCLLADDGVVVAESPYLGDFLEHVEFDTIYHEHLCYYSLTALCRLFDRHGLAIEHCERVPIHGGSLRIVARHARVARPTAAVATLLANEREWGVDVDEPYARFASRVEHLKADITAIVRQLRRGGQRVCAYGAAAKGTVLLNSCGLGVEDLDFVCDRNALKQGRLMPGAHVPIVAAEQLMARDVNYCLLLAWNLADEVRREQAAWTARGGKFIIPIPAVRVVS